MSIAINERGTIRTLITDYYGETHTITLDQANAHDLHQALTDALNPVTTTPSKARLMRYPIRINHE